MRLAMLKSPLPSRPFAHQVGSLIDHSAYSHAEIIFADRMTGSAWAHGGGVQVKQMPVGYYDDPTRWDFYWLPDSQEEQTRRRFETLAVDPQGYDHFGVIRFGFCLAEQSKAKYFCTESCAECLLGMGDDSWRIGPGLLVSLCKRMFGSYLVASPWTPASPDAEPVHPAFFAAARGDRLV